MKRIDLFTTIALALSLVACEKKSEISIRDTTAMTMPLPTAETTAAIVLHDTLRSPTHHSDGLALRPALDERNITVDFPKPGQRIGGPVFPVHGSARTFENSVSYKLLSATGTVLSSGHGMSHGTMGEFGPYDFQVQSGSYSGKAMLEVFDNSPKDGKEIDKVSIPLELAADTIGVSSADRIAPLPRKK